MTSKNLWIFSGVLLLMIGLTNIYWWNRHSFVPRYNAVPQANGIVFCTANYWFDTVPQFITWWLDCTVSYFCQLQHTTAEARSRVAGWEDDWGIFPNLQQHLPRQAIFKRENPISTDKKTAQRSVGTCVERNKMSKPEEFLFLFWRGCFLQIGVRIYLLSAYVLWLGFRSVLKCLTRHIGYSDEGETRKMQPITFCIERQRRAYANHIECWRSFFPI